jgi:hypothetical protein
MSTAPLQAAAEHPAIQDPLVIQPTRREVLRNLGYPRSRGPAEQVEQTLDRLWPEAEALLRPRGAYRVVSAEQIAAAGMPQPTELVGLGLGTIGPGLEHRERDLGRQGQLLEALLLDAFGSAAAEAAADAVNLLLCRRAQELGYRLPPRISPGFGAWALEGQRALLPLLDAGALGVTLTEGLMMVPRKSISFGVRFSREGGLSRVERLRCATCDLEGCAYRRDPEDDRDDRDARDAEDDERS